MCVQDESKWKERKAFLHLITSVFRIQINDKRMSKNGMSWLKF